MSLCLVIQTKNQICIAADSRGSMVVNGETYATGQEVQKIHVVGNQVVYAGGYSDIAKAVIYDYKKSKNYTLNNLQSIMKKRVAQFIDQYGPDYPLESDHIGVVVCCYEEGMTKFFAIRSPDFKIVENIGHPARACSGFRMDEAATLLKQYRDMNTVDAFAKVYGALAEESIGGHMTFFVIDRSGIRWTNRAIPDCRKIKTLNDISMLLREKGLIIEKDDRSSRVIMNSDEMEWSVNGVRRLYYNNVENRLCFSGTLEAADGIFSGDLSAVGGTFTGTLQGVDGSFSGTISASTITGSTINGGTITGSLIRTAAAGNRIEFSSAENFLKAVNEAGNTFTIKPSITGTPGFEWNNGTDLMQMFLMPGFFSINTVGLPTSITVASGRDINLNPAGGYKVRLPMWDSLYSNSAGGGSGRTLQQELNDIWMAIASLSAVPPPTSEPQP